MLTPYQFSTNSPIVNIDLDVLERVKITDVEKKPITVVTDIVYVLKQSKKVRGSNLNEKQLERIRKHLY